MLKNWFYISLGSRISSKLLAHSKVSWVRRQKLTLLNLIVWLTTWKGKTTRFTWRRRKRFVRSLLKRLKNWGRSIITVRKTNSKVPLSPENVRNRARKTKQLLSVLVNQEMKDLVMSWKMAHQILSELLKVIFRALSPPQTQLLSPSSQLVNFNHYRRYRVF